ncbi:MAG: hypothetical protein RLZZ501_2537 [Pseudomonadota bacterium]|jgi:predicted exporter
MSRLRLVAALGWLGLVLAAAGWLGWHGVTLATDLTALLPAGQADPALAAATARINQDLAGRVVLLVGANAPERARAAAARLRDGLAADGAFIPGRDVPDAEALRRLAATCFPHRAGLLAEADRRRLAAGQGDALVERALAQVFGVGGLADARLLVQDPFLLFPAFLSSLPLPASRLAVEEGWPTLHENGMTWVLLSGRVGGNPQAMADQRRFVAATGTAADAARAEFPELRLLRLGAVFYADAAGRQGMDEGSLIGLLSGLGTILLLAAVFRRAGPVLLSLGAVAAAMAVAVAATVAAFGAIHVAALAFGGSLIGVGVDYALIYFAQIFAGPCTPRQRLARVWVGALLGLLTSLIGYAALALAPLPGLRQVALFSAVGLVAAFLAMALWFPLLDRSPARKLPAVLARPCRALWRLGADPGQRRLRRVILAVLLLAAGLGAARLECDDDIRRQQALDPTLKAEQAELVRLTGLSLGGQALVVAAADTETALRREEALAERLAPLREAGQLGGWHGPAGFVPSAARQADTAALLDRALYAPHLAAYRATIGLPDLPDLPDLPSVPPAPPLTPEAVRATGAIPLLDLLMIAPGLHLVLLDPPFDPLALRRVLDGLDGVRLLDPTADLSVLLATYRDRAVGLLALSALLMVPLLALRYRWRGALRVLAPPVLAVVLTPPLLALAGVPFSFFAAMALVLTLAVGVDYSVFCAEAGPAGDDATQLATLLAALTTQLSFGLLVFSAVAGLRGFGATMLLGLALAVLAAPAAAVARRSPR